MRGRFESLLAGGGALSSVHGAQAAAADAFTLASQAYQDIDKLVIKSAGTLRPGPTPNGPHGRQLSAGWQ